jgi:hypothetical protein
MEMHLHKTRRPRALKRLCFITKNAEEQGEEVLFLFVRAVDCVFVYLKR